LIKTGTWIAVKEHHKICTTVTAEWLTIQSRSGMTVKCAPLHYALGQMTPLDMSGQSLPKDKRHSLRRWLKEMLCP